MAKATRKTELVEVTKEVTVTEPVESYTLVLSKTEAELVKALVGQLVGNTKKPYRKAASAVYYALAGSGLRESLKVVSDHGGYASYKIEGE